MFVWAGLPDGPARLGSLRVDGTDLAWQAAADSGAVVEGGGAIADGWQVLLTDLNGAPSRVVFGSLVFFVIEREGSHPFADYVANGSAHQAFTWLLDCLH